FSMKQLLVNIPEINNVLSFQKRENPMVKAVLDKGCIRLPAHTADAYNMSAQRFIEHVKYHLNWVLSGKDKDWLTFSADQKEYHPSTSTSLLFDLESGTFLFPAARDRFLKLPEILIHYLIAYNLSMIARYETEWWYDLLLQ
ncbi:hypothetical protein GWP49_35780, partial [Klebsiella pneumoniae]|nr:hypothetical protein [Klebsiella pneumoniae]